MSSSEPYQQTQPKDIRFRQQEARPRRDLEQKSGNHGERPGPGPGQTQSEVTKPTTGPASWWGKGSRHTARIG